MAVVGGLLLGGLGQAGWAADAGAVKRPAITGLAYVRFYESDMAASKHFYGEWLGLHETDDSKGGASFAVGMRQRIEIAPLPQGAESRLAAVGFLTKDVGGMQRYLAAHGLKVERVDADEIDVRDPEGNLMAFVGDRQGGGGDGRGGWEDAGDGDGGDGQGGGADLAADDPCGVQGAEPGCGE